MENNKRAHVRKPGLIIGAAVLLVGAMAMAGNGNDRGRGNNADFVPPGQQTETIDFWVDFHGKLARKPNELIVITSEPDETIEMGTGCLTGEPENTSGYHRVIVNHQGQIEGGAEQASLILPKAVNRGSRLTDVTFVARCFSEIDETLYDKFTAELHETGSSR